MAVESALFCDDLFNVDSWYDARQPEEQRREHTTILLGVVHAYAIAIRLHCNDGDC